MVLEKFLVLSIVLSSALVFFLLLLIAGIVFYFIKNRKPIFPQSLQEPIPDEKRLLRSKSQSDGPFCKIHSKEKATGTCAICEESFCTPCLVNHNNLLFCQEHYKIFASNEWEKVLSVHTTANEPEKGIFLYEMKKVLWKGKTLPTYIETEYKINFETDMIESFVSLYARKQDKSTIEQNKYH